MKRIVLLIVLSVSSFILDAQTFRAVRDEASVLSVIGERTAGVTSIASDFRQEKYLSVFSSSVVSTGRFYYEKPDRICLDYDGSPKYKIVINASKLMTVTAGKSSVMTVGGNPMMQQMKNLISACMTGNISGLKQGYRISCKESDSEYLLVVEPVSETVKAYIREMQIYFGKSDFAVSRIVLKETEDDYTEYRFTARKFNAGIDGKIFEIR